MEVIALRSTSSSVGMTNVRNGGGPGPIRHEGPPIRKKNVSLVSHILSLYLCNYPSAVAPVAACEATLVRLC